MKCSIQRVKLVRAQGFEHSSYDIFFPFMKSVYFIFIYVTRNTIFAVIREVFATTIIFSLISAKTGKACIFEYKRACS